MNKDNIKWMIFGIVIVLAIGIIYVFFFSNSNKVGVNNKDPGLLTENDFEILSVSWNQDSSWDTICELSPTDSENIMYSLNTKQNSDLECEFTINGNKKDSTWIFEKGTKFIDEGLHNVPIFKNNVITICCSSYGNEGEICDTVTLPAKC